MNKELEGKVIVNNVPPYAEGLYIVAMASYGELWFYGAWENEADAEDVAKEKADAVIVRG